MSERVRERAMLPLSELVANSVCHSGLSAPEEVEVSVRSVPGGLHVEVVDHGVGIEEPPPPPEPGHYGLRFVNTVTDQWGYTNRPTRVWFEILEP
jgi:anti-sigma regulatory factor (Ser/Thr protein kinase)